MHEADYDLNINKDVPLRKRGAGDLKRKKRAKGCADKRRKFWPTSARMYADARHGPTSDAVSETAYVELRLTPAVHFPVGFQSIKIPAGQSSRLPAEEKHSTLSRSPRWYPSAPPGIVLLARRRSAVAENNGMRECVDIEGQEFGMLPH